MTLLPKALIIAALPLSLAACNAHTTTVTRTERVIAAPTVTPQSGGGASIAFEGGCTVTYSANGALATNTPICTPGQVQQAQAAFSSHMTRSM